MSKLVSTSYEAAAPGHHTDLAGYPEVKPSVASLQATVMSNAAAAAAAAYQSQLNLAARGAGGATASGTADSSTAGLLGASHHGDVTLLQDYHTL
ncbi:hypothetical protein B566_EDAN001621 [Ephemera danica]|nr:hypothetical protein B566_EDAN001621 [Ephemera danica]